MRVILLSKNSRDQIFFKKAAEVAQLEMITVASAEQACQEVQRDGSAIVIVDTPTEQSYKDFEKCVSDTIGLFNDMISPNAFFFVADAELHERSFLGQAELLGTVIPRIYNEVSSETDHGVVGRILAQVAHEKSALPLKGVTRFLNANAKVQSLQITRASQKKAVVEALKDYLLKAGFKSRPAAIVATAVDELIMNAIFDAPVDQTGKFIYTQTPRNTELELEGRHVVEMEVAFDGNLFAVSVRDQFGSLDKKKLLGHLSKSYKDEEFKVKTNVAGAGLGLANVLRNCGGLVFECEMGVTTQVTVFYQRTDSFKEFKDQFKFLTTLMYFS